MRKPVQPGAADEVARRRRRRLIRLAILAAAVVLVAVIAYILLQPGPPLRLLSITFSPDPAVPDEPITVVAQAQGGTLLAPLSVSVNGATFFGSGYAMAGRSLVSRGGGSYAGTIGPFASGTVVWFVVTAADGHSFQVADSVTVEVGPVMHGGSSGLRLNSVRLMPPQPTSLDEPVVLVNVTSNATITSVPFSYMWFYAASGWTSSGGGSGSLTPTTDGNYTSMPLLGANWGGPSAATTIGTVWLYRVGAEDATGNTVLSPPYRFTVASPWT